MSRKDKGTDKSRVAKALQRLRRAVHNHARKKGQADSQFDKISISVLTGAAVAALVGYVARRPMRATGPPSQHGMRVWVPTC